MGYESEWAFETANDFMKMDGILKPFFSPAFGGPAATDEECTKSLGLLCQWFDKLQARYSDGRAYSAGDKITAADFALVSADVGMWSNPHTKSGNFAATVKAELAKRDKVQAIIDKVKGE